MAALLVFGKYFLHTHSHMTPTLKQGRVETLVGAEGRVGETGLGRRKTEEKT